MEIRLLNQLGTLSHPQRMAIFRLLMRRYPDQVPAGEICAALALKASTSSVYLSALTQAELLTQTRNGTSLLYRLNMPAAQKMVDDLFYDCCNGRADLSPTQMSLTPLKQKDAAMTAPHNVLFICTGNSARSIFAEAILRHEASEKFNAYSAGTKPFSELNPFAVEMLKDKGLDASVLRAKNIAEFQSEDAPQMDFVFTVCDRAANEECASWPGQPISAHWGLKDPVKAEGSDAEKRLAFQHTFGVMKNRIKAFAALPFDTLDRISLQQRVDAISSLPETS